MAYTDIDKPDLYFNTKLYTGDGTTSNSITGVGFQPDWIWIKKRNSIASHRLLDSIRGVQKHLASDNTDAEVTQNSVMSFDTDGFTVGDSAGTNGSSDTFASWNWLASNTTASNTDGSITSTVSANTTSGFSIVSYTGTGANATVGHGLGVAPAMIIIKNRDDGTRNWGVYHKSLGSGNAIRLNQTSASFSTTNFWNSTEPTSTVWSMGNQFDVNDSGDNNIAYCFAEKKGFSKAFSYTGNGSTDGTYIHLGFKPAWFMIKKSSAAGDSWVIIDNTRFPYNYVDKFIYADEADAESGSAERLDILSNGIKLRATHPFINTSGATYIYMAFAENPLVGTNNIPATAR